MIYQVENKPEPHAQVSKRSWLSENKKWVIPMIVAGVAIPVWLHFTPGAENLSQQAATPTLNSQQERLLRTIHTYQVRFGARKLIVLRTGQLVFDEPDRKDIKINLAREVLGNAHMPDVMAKEFETLMESIPPEFFRVIPEARFSSPFVVTVTEVGVKYLNGS